jgi:acyl transferase domain-containing protein/acyl carrier protein
MNSTATDFSEMDLDIAIIGMAGRFPGAKTLDEYWRNLRDGVESITFFTDEEMRDAGVPPEVIADPLHIRAGAPLEDSELFDAAFFDYSPREAELTDPQHRVFLECAQAAIEDAGYNPESYDKLIGIYAGSSMSSYLIFNLYANREALGSTAVQQVKISNGSDFLATRTSYKLNLEGPSVNVQTACSTSLVAVHLACQSLLNYQCDMALAGGVSVASAQKTGYFYLEEGILSPDGHCRAFDAKAQGTIGGNGAGIVVLKRLSDALRDRDSVYAVIKGSAINNDGSSKVGFTAPREDGQAAVITMALASAGVEAETISYVEGHGSGTALGDPIEVSALTKAFRASTDKQQFCAIGSVKTNIGHLDAAAGVASLIKTVLALRHKQLPPSLHFNQPNPDIDFASSPFFVNSTLRDWESDSHPRRAGVSSFGIGGTNAHIVLEEAPQITEAKESGAQSNSRQQQLLVLSAKSEAALEAATKNLAAHLRQHPRQSFADLSYTLQVGRRPFPFRRALVCESREDAIAALELPGCPQALTGFQEDGNQSVAFMFPGLGDHYLNMARELYYAEPAFREPVDKCFDLLMPHLGVDLREVLYPGERQEFEAAQNSKRATASQGINLREMLKRGEAKPDEASERLNQTYLTQPIVFVIEYALAQMWMSWGVRPTAMIGYSIGEYVAAVLSGVMSLEDGLRLIAVRGALIQKLEKGAMLAVALGEDEIKPLLGEQLSIAALNGNGMSVVAGRESAVVEMERTLAGKGIVCRRLPTTHAFHSKMMEDVIEPFTSEMRAIELHAPQIPFVSNVTGKWITAEDAQNPNYWSAHLREAVRFGDGLRQLLDSGWRVLVEVGAGQSLSSLAMQAENSSDQSIHNPLLLVSSLRHAYERESDVTYLQRALGKLWVAGLEIDWERYHGTAALERRRVSAPGYPFQRQRYWIDAPSSSSSENTASRTQPSRSVNKQPDLADWFYLPSWKRVLPLAAGAETSVANSRWLLFLDQTPVGQSLLGLLTKQGAAVVCVRPGAGFARLDQSNFIINPDSPQDYQMLLGALGAENRMPQRILHLWTLSAADAGQAAGVAGVRERFATVQSEGYYSLLFLAQALAEKPTGAGGLRLSVVASHLHEVTGTERLAPEKATLVGACKVLAQEYAHLRCQSIDLEVPSTTLGPAQAQWLARQLILEIEAEGYEPLVAYRGGHRWLQSYEKMRVEERPLTERLRERGVYLITGGLGRIGLTAAEVLAREVQARLVLVGRDGLPERDEWEHVLTSETADAKVRERIKGVQSVESLGAEVLVLGTDVSDRAQLEEALRRAEARFGRIDGVIHAAGMVGEAAHRLMSETDVSQSELHFVPKVYGLYALEEVLAEREYDFCLLTSSLSPVLGGLGFYAYASANSFMDAYACAHNREGKVRWQSVNWEGWQAREEAAGAEERAGGIGLEVKQMALKRSEGLASWRRVLPVGEVSQIIISSGELGERVEQWTRMGWEAEALSETVEEDGSLAASPATALHSRPNLRNPYVAPGNEAEADIANIWQELLGIKQVGVNDNFFELGGNSLIGLQFINKLRKKLDYTVPLTLIYEAPTVSTLANLITQGSDQKPTYDQRASRGERRREKQKARRQHQ